MRFALALLTIQMSVIFLLITGMIIFNVHKFRLLDSFTLMLTTCNVEPAIMFINTCDSSNNNAYHWLILSSHHQKALTYKLTNKNVNRL